MTRHSLRKLVPNDQLEKVKLLRTLIDALPDCICVKDLEGHYLFNNAAHVKKLGAASPEEVVGKTDFDFDPEELAERYYADEQEILRSGQPLIGKEEPNIDEDGNERWNSTSKMPLYDDTGELVGIVGVTRDVTEGKWVEEALRKSEENLAHAQRIARLGSWEWNVKTGEVSWSDEAFRIYGFTPGQVIPSLDKLMEVVHPDDRGLVEKRRHAALCANEPYDFEHRIVRQDGEVRVVHRQAEVVCDEEGEPLRMVGTVHDVTEQKEAEEALERLNRHNELILNSAGEGIYGLNLQGKTTFVNPAALNLTGWEADELIDRHQHDLIHHTKADGTPYPGEECPIYAALKDGTVHRITDEVFWRKDGTSFPVEYVCTPIRERGELVGAVVVFEDVTERKRAEDKLKESERRFRSLHRNATDLITVLEEDGTISYESPTVERILGYLPEERVGKNAFDYLHPDDTMQSKATFAEALDNPGKVQPPVEFRLRHKDGSWRWMETTRTNLLDDPAVRGVVANSRDITERKEAERALRESEERFRTAFEDAPIGVALVGLDRSHLRVNRAYCEMLGFTEEELLAKPHPEIIHPDDREESAERIRGILEQGAKPYALERRYLHADGHEVWSLSHISLIRDSQGKPSHFVCLHVDVTERKELEEHLEHQAFHDSLTDLPNRALFLNRLAHALAQTGREDGPVAVLLLDLNHFKVINDSLGHDAGNVALVGVAERLRASVRPGDTVGRIFGDEFAVLLGAPSGMDEARRVAGRIQERLQEPLEVEAQEVLVSPSIGIALGNTQDSPEEVLRRADLAMYTAKKRGKAECEEYSPAMEAPVANRVDLEQDLRRAVEREEFEAHYQPIVELHTGEIVGVEALARWRHPERGLVEAAEFIETAEETGLIRTIGRRVIEEACRQAKEWRQRYPQRAPMLSVNLSANQFVQQPDLIPKVLEETGLEPSALQVEITERAVMGDAEFALVKLKELKALGVSLAIDDFGMGYSCLYHLKHMPIDFLKIDRAFVVGLGDDQGDEAIVSGTVSLAHALGVITVAEGVETAEQQEILRELGCDFAQGYHFGKPLPREAMEKLLADGASY